MSINNNDSANLGTAAATGGGVLGASLASFFSRNAFAIALAAALLAVIAYAIYQTLKSRKK